MKGTVGWLGGIYLAQRNYANAFGMFDLVCGEISQLASENAFFIASK